MGKRISNFVNKILVGSEKSEGYARASLPSNRWELFWDIFKGRFWKLVVLNLLVLLFFIPLFIYIYFREILIAGYGAMYPFAQGFGVGYQAPISMVGYEQNIVFSVNVFANSFFPIVMAIAAVGIAGGAYVMRNMVWTEGIFVANDFWQGVKKNYKQIFLISFSFSFVFYITQVAISLAQQNVAVGSSISWLYIISEYVSYLILAIYTIMCLHMITMSVTYELKFTQLLKNSFLFTVGLIPQNLFFIFLGTLPFFVLMLGQFFMSIGIMLILFIGFSLILLVWTNYCQWGYDKYINDRIPNAKKGRGIYEKVKESNAAALKQYREQVVIMKSSLNSKPIKPITDDELKLAELPTSFNRKDIERLNQSRKELYEDNERYIEEHKNDPKYLPSEEELAEQKKSEEREKRIEKAKKELAKRKK